MGDRANIYLVDDEPEAGIYLYTHWSGSEWPEELRKALVAGAVRWEDKSYLARIIASNVFSDIHEEHYGGGISTRITDNEHDIIVCDLKNDTVSFAKEGTEHNVEKWCNTMSFADYVEQDEATYPEKLVLGAAKPNYAEALATAAIEYAESVAVDCDSSKARQRLESAAIVFVSSPYES